MMIIIIISSTEMLMECQLLIRDVLFLKRTVVGNWLVQFNLKVSRL